MAHHELYVRDLLDPKKVYFMKCKNILIVLLIASVLLNIFVGYKFFLLQQEANSIGLINSESLDDIRKLFPNEEAMVNSMREFIINRYNLYPENCGPAVSLSVRNVHAGSDEFDMACLITGNRKIVYTTLQSIKDNTYEKLQSLKKNLDTLFINFDYFIKKENIKELEEVSYRPEGERDAFLFVKQWLLSGKRCISNDYLCGFLLGYGKDDIEFFYQRIAFDIYLHKNKLVEDDFMPPFTYPEFSPQLRKQFEQFKKTAWLQSQDYEQYNQDKKNALEWVEENKKFTNEQLYQQINELKKLQDKSSGSL